MENANIVGNTGLTNHMVLTGTAMPAELPWKTHMWIRRSGLSWKTGCWSWGATLALRTSSRAGSGTHLLSPSGLLFLTSTAAALRSDVNQGCAPARPLEWHASSQGYGISGSAYPIQYSRGPDYHNQ